MEPITLLINAISDLTDVDISTLSGDTIVTDTGLDSLDYVDLFLRIKKEYGIHVDPEALTAQKLATLDDLSGYIYERINN